MSFNQDANTASFAQSTFAHNTKLLMSNAEENSPAEEGHKGQQLGWHCAKVKSSLYVDDIVGEQVVGEKGGFVHAGHVSRDGGSFRGDV